MEQVEFRKAKKEDVPYIIKILADDKLGKLREDFQYPLPITYYQAFEKILRDPNQELMVLTSKEEGILGTFQMSYIQYLTYQGGIRAQIEAVRLRDDKRGKGLGKLLIEWAIARAKQKGAHLLQLTSDKQRPEAIRYYEKYGFSASHEGMKLHFKNHPNPTTS